MIAADLGFFHIMLCLLVRNDLKTDIKSPAGHTASHYASVKGHKDIVGILPR